MNIITIILVSLAILSCGKNQQSQKQPVEPNQEIETSGSEEPLKTEESSRDEVMDIDSVWLNDQIPFSSTPSLVKEVLGEPDSVTIPNYECGGYIAGEEPWGDIVELMHYQGTKIVTFKDKAELTTIKVREWDCTLHHPGIILSGYTTLEELGDVFPEAVRESYDWDDVRDNNTYRLVRIAPKPLSDNEWVLKFLDDILIEIQYWIPC